MARNPFTISSADTPSAFSDARCLSPQEHVIHRKHPDQNAFFGYDGETTHATFPHRGERDAHLVLRRRTISTEQGA
jgi:hypothetical protein